MNKASYSAPTMALKSHKYTAAWTAYGFISFHITTLQGHCKREFLGHKSYLSTTNVIEKAENWRISKWFRNTKKKNPKALTNKENV